MKVKKFLRIMIKFSKIMREKEVHTSEKAPINLIFIDNILAHKL